MFNPFKRKLSKEGIKKAKELGFITEEEYFILKLKRADRQLKDYQKKHTDKKRRK